MTDDLMTDDLMHRYPDPECSTLLTSSAALDHTLLMTSLYGRCIGVFAVICILAMFFFPLVQGPFQATHGPTTALRSKRAFLILLLTIVMASLQLVAFLFPILLRTVHFFMRDNHSGQRWSLAGCDGILRC